MNDDRQHEYVPPVARDILDGQRIAAVAAYAEAQRKAYNLQILYDDAMAMLSAMTAERDALRGLVEESIEHASWLEAYAEQLPFDSGFVTGVQDYITRAKGAIQPKREDDER